MNSELSAGLSWQMNRELPTEYERDKANPRKHLKHVDWRPVKLRPLIYPESRNYMLCELLANWAWRNLKLDLNETIEVGTARGFSYLRVKGRTFAEYRYSITELDRDSERV